LPSFNLRKDGVQVEVMEWVGELDHFNELKEVWIMLEGIPPRWCDWKVFSQMTSGLSLLLEVDWAALFKSFYEHVRLKIAHRDPKKIPIERLFELEKKLYLVNISVEGLEAENNGKTDDDGDDKGDEDGEDVDDNYDGLDDSDQMETTDSKTPDVALSKSQQPRGGAPCKTAGNDGPVEMGQVEDGGGTELPESE
jgi:hypothetical protein